MKYFDWDDAKNAKLRAERGIGFEDIGFHIERGDLLDILEHPHPDRYPWIDRPDTHASTLPTVSVKCLPAGWQRDARFNRAAAG